MLILGETAMAQSLVTNPWAWGCAVLCVLVFVVVIVAGFMYDSSVERAKRETQRLNDIVNGLPLTRRIEYQERIVENLGRRIGGQGRSAVQVAREIGENVETVFAFLQSMMRTGDVLPDVARAQEIPSTEVSRYTPMRLTQQGEQRYMGQTRNGNIVTVGDGSVYVADSTVIKSFNDLSHRYDLGVVEALKQIAVLVAASNNAEAGEVLGDFTSELRSESPKRSALRLMFDRLVELVPPIASLAAAIVPLFTSSSS